MRSAVYAVHKHSTEDILIQLAELEAYRVKNKKLDKIKLDKWKILSEKVQVRRPLNCCADWGSQIACGVVILSYYSLIDAVEAVGECGQWDLGGWFKSIHTICMIAGWRQGDHGAN
jgi:hypothetical protein